MDRVEANPGTVVNREEPAIWDRLPRRVEVILVFDGRCGFCSACVELLGRSRHADRIACVPCQSRWVEDFPPGPAEGCLSTAWTVRRDGERRSGSAAVLEALSVATGRRWLGRVPAWPVVGWTGEKVYRLVARYRGWLPGTAPYCRRHPEACDRGR